MHYAYFSNINNKIKLFMQLLEINNCYFHFFIDAE